MTSAKQILGGWPSIFISFVLGCALALGILLAGSTSDAGRAATATSSGSAVSYESLEANLTEEQKTAIAPLVVEGKVTWVKHGLVEDDPHGLEYQDMPWNGKEAIDLGKKQTKVTFSINTWIKDSSPEEIYLLVYHHPDGTGAPPFLTQELIDAVLAGKRLRVWLFDNELHPRDGTHWTLGDAAVIE